MADLQYTYLGTMKEGDGRTVAVINLSGTLRGQRAGGANVGGKVDGAAVVDVATGMTVSNGATLTVDMDLTLRKQTVKAMGTLNVDLRRAPVKPKE
jgi:hypothetical protein